MCPESVLWQNDLLDPDAVLGGKWGWSREACIRWGGDHQRGRCSFRVNVGHPIVTNGTLWRSYSLP